MKVFLSWSGDLSRSVALVFRDWLPSVVQCLEPYVSSEDIDKGARWATDIAKELEASGFGILCVTAENLEAPWLHFEAGALSKTLDKTRVCPFLLGVKRSDIQGPLLQFQSTVYEEEDVKKLVFSINAACGEDKLEDGRLGTIFEVWWPRLKERLDEREAQATVLGVHHEAGGDGVGGDAGHAAILEEILELTRNQQRLLRSPEELLPAPYLREAVGGTAILGVPGEHPVWEDLAAAVGETREILRHMEDDPEMVSRMAPDALRRLLRPADYIVARASQRRLRPRV